MKALRLLRSSIPLFLALLLAGAGPTPTAAQNILLPTDSLERLLRHATFDIFARADTRFEGDRTQRVALDFGDGLQVAVKWARAPRGGEAFNNQPRYEIAAYELQKLFLDEPDYVVPPTVARLVPLEFYAAFDPAVAPTFSPRWGVLVSLHYWLFNVRQRDVFELERFHADSVYARHLANANLHSYLVRHLDSNVGNFLLSTDPANPRVFSVDHGVAFRSRPSNVGTDWQDIRVPRLPASTVERLRRVRRDDLNAALAVVAQFEMRDGVPTPVAPGPRRSPRRGVVEQGEVLQLGLTAGEIDDIWRRLQRLLRAVDRGRYELF
jgi:hypothetical protein